MTREEKILAYMNSEAYIPMRDDELAIVLDVPAVDLPAFQSILDKLMAQGQIVANKKGRLKAVGAKKITGKFKAMRSGGFVDALDESRSVFVPLAYTSGAIDGDIVTCVLRDKKRKHADDKDEGEITEILRHTLTHVVGTLTYYGNTLYLEPDDAALRFAVRIRDAHGVKGSEKAVAKIERYPKATAYAEGVLTEILGKNGNTEVELLAISHKAGLKTEFPEAVLTNAQAVAKEPILPDGRTDFRHQRVITIDGEDSKDFDDAVCVEKTETGYILYVHIADVAHYVIQNSPLDKEAYLRGTSVYYPGMVLPMLPPELSNGICSLNESEDRYTLSVTMHIDADGNVMDYKIENGIIRSWHRMTYTKVTQMLEDADSPLNEQYSDIKDMLVHMRSLADILTNKRSARGSIDFNIPEPYIVLDENHFPVSVAAHESGISNKIIEEFMLLANETVARFAFDNHLPFIYRIHESPSQDKADTLNAFLKFIGLQTVKPKGEIQPKDFAQVIEQAQESDNPSLICTLTLRAMMKARYAEENLGHFGLAAQYYCHFTSPIRRYPDLFIHRVIKTFLSEKADKADIAHLHAIAKPTAQHATETEINAMEAEREADKYFTCLYMKQFIGCEFEAVISSLTDFGMFVTVQNAVDGMIPLSMLDDDYYRYEPSLYCMRGERTRKTYALGDTIQVKLINVSEHDRKIDFAPIGVLKRERKPYQKLLQDKKKSDKKSQKQKGKTKKFIRKKR